METNIINVGNSKGIIIPAKFLKMMGLSNVVNVEIDQGKLVISPATKPRQGWAEMFEQEISKNGHLKPYLPDVFEDENTDDWTW